MSCMCTTSHSALHRVLPPQLYFLLLNIHSDQIVPELAIRGKLTISYYPVPKYILPTCHQHHRDGLSKQQIKKRKPTDMDGNLQVCLHPFKRKVNIPRLAVGQRHQRLGDITVTIGPSSHGWPRQNNPISHSSNSSSSSSTREPNKRMSQLNQPFVVNSLASTGIQTLTEI